ncbi:Fibroblast growth factor-binding protein 1 [Nibea albiflora]|uniref:Fibroblast growth factor-binding protein 1 n=1 Tax=Nibea albiflora TaxID=240163 RepID=A0ACB7FLI2_NIBAL|nr:Fibroblast growth factor-binding protein 1 [Nibea albiflora]
MLLLRTFAPWLLLAFIGHQVSLSSGARNKNKAVEKTVTPASGRAQRSGDKSAATGRGKFSTNDKMQCTWTATNVGAIMRLSSDRKNFWKQVSRAFKRMQGKVCKDDRALVKAGMCKRAHRDAHFKLDLSSSVTSAQSGEPETPKLPQPPRSTAASTPTSTSPTACTKRADHRKKAEEHCSSSWASLCTFFFSMLQSDDC